MAAVGIRIFNLLKCCKRTHDFRAGFKSVYSLDQLYPNSRYDFSSKFDEQAKASAAKSSDFHGYIPTEELQIRYSRSSGPGGQNVNKVNTKVEVRFHLDSVTFINDNIKKLLRENCSTRITKDGYFSVVSEKTRTRNYNLADCLDKIRFMIRNLDQPTRELTSDEQEILAARARKAAQDRLKEKRDHAIKKDGRTMNIN